MICFCCLYLNSMVVVCVIHWSIRFLDWLLTLLDLNGDDCCLRYDSSCNMTSLEWIWITWLFIERYGYECMLLAQSVPTKLLQFHSSQQFQYHFLLWDYHCHCSNGTWSLTGMGLGTADKLNKLNIFRWKIIFPCYLPSHQNLSSNEKGYMLPGWKNSKNIWNMGFLFLC